MSVQNHPHSLLLTFAGSGIAESLSEGVVVDLELGYPLILVGGDSKELTLPEDVRPEGGVGQLHDVAGPDQVEAGLVLVHRVQDGLQ